MPRGRPKGSRNRQLDFPDDRTPPTNWSTESINFPQTRRAVHVDGGAALPTNFGECTAYKVFRLLWSEEMDEHVLNRTNRHCSLNLDQTSLHRFLLSGLIMCLNSRNDYKLHWSQDSLYENMEVKKLISKHEFCSILHHAHPKPHVLVKLANTHFQRYWKPYSHVSIDEGLICFKGRYEHRVHIRGKPDATGLKIYGLADEKSYLYAFLLYEGQHHTVFEIVEELLDQLPSSHFKFYADAWYGSDRLAFLLIKKHFFFTLACGKHKPDDVFDNYLDIRLAKGQCRYLQSELCPSLFAISYYDRAKCHFLTNHKRPGMVENHNGENIPEAVQDYRQYMGLTDRVNGQVLKSTWPHRNHRWTMAFFWYLIGLCVTNAHKIYNDTNPGHTSIAAFMHQLVTEWRAVIETNLSAPPSTRHNLILSDFSSRCEVCKYVDRNISKTKLLCSSCNVYLHRHCFAKYHKQR